MAKSKDTPWLNRMQKDGLARAFDGLVIAAVISLVSYVTNRLALDRSEVILLVIAALFVEFCGLYLRKD